MDLLPTSAGKVIIREADSSILMKGFAGCKNSQEKRRGYIGETNFHVFLTVLYIFQTNLKQVFVEDDLLKDVCIDNNLGKLCLTQD